MAVPAPRTSPGDPVGAFLEGPRLTRAATGHGPLDGRSCAVKDVFDIAGTVTGYGNPTWALTHAPAAANAAVVDRILAAGAHVVGKTLTDELAFSLSGANHHYGAPLNTAAPDRLTGGSSCGSVAAVAAGLCDFALGTDTGGSVRAPASFCGVYGFRPTHGAVSSAGVRALARSFDTVGWFARSADLLRSVGDVLLPDDSGTLDAGRQHWDAEAWDLLEAPLAEGEVARLADGLPPARERTQAPVSGGGLNLWFDAFRTLQLAEVWAEFGDWIARNKPVLGPGIAERLDAASRLTLKEVHAAESDRAAARERLERHDLIVIPTVPGAAPLRSAEVATLEAYRGHAMRLLCIAGLSGRPQVTLPLLQSSGAPLGLSLIGRPGTDRQLLRLAVDMAGAAAGRP